MNILHNAEAVFAIAVGLTVGAGAMLPAASTSGVKPPVQEVSIATPQRMAVVQVTARRLSVTEKMRSLELERSLARASAGSPAARG